MYLGVLGGLVGLSDHYVVCWICGISGSFLSSFL